MTAMPKNRKLKPLEPTTVTCDHCRRVVPVAPHEGRAKTIIEGLVS